MTTQTYIPNPEVWQKELIYQKRKVKLAKMNGENETVRVPICMTSNIITILTHDPEFAGRLKYNEFDQVVYIDGAAISTTAVNNIRDTLERKWFFKSVPKSHVRSAINFVATDRPKMQ